MSISADYTSDAGMSPSSGEATIEAIRLSGSARPVHTYLAYAVHAVFTLTLSRPSNQLVTLHVQTRDGTGKRAAHAADGDYHPLNRNVTINAGATTSTVDVTVYPQVDVRAAASFGLVLSKIQGVAVAAGASTMTRSLVPADTGRSTVLSETIDPDLVVGRVTALK